MFPTNPQKISQKKSLLKIFQTSLKIFFNKISIKKCSKRTIRKNSQNKIFIKKNVPNEPKINFSTKFQSNNAPNKFLKQIFIKLKLQYVIIFIIIRI